MTTAGKPQGSPIVASALPICPPPAITRVAAGSCRSNITWYAAAPSACPRLSREPAAAESCDPPGGGRDAPPQAPPRARPRDPDPVAERAPHEDALVAAPPRRGVVADVVIGEPPLYRLEVVDGDGEVVPQRRAERGLLQNDMQLRHLVQGEREGARGDR